MLERRIDICAMAFNPPLLPLKRDENTLRLYEDTEVLHGDTLRLYEDAQALCSDTERL
jgi:hypothetical protein